MWLCLSLVVVCLHDCVIDWLIVFVYRVLVCVVVRLCDYVCVVCWLVRLHDCVTVCCLLCCVVDWLCVVWLLV